MLSKSFLAFLSCSLCPHLTDRHWKLEMAYVIYPSDFNESPPTSVPMEYLISTFDLHCLMLLLHLCEHTLLTDHGGEEEYCHRRYVPFLPYRPTTQPEKTPAYNLDVTARVVTLHGQFMSRLGHGLAWLATLYLTSSPRRRHYWQHNRLLPDTPSQVQSGSAHHHPLRGRPVGSSGCFWQGGRPSWPLGLSCVSRSFVV